MSIAGRILSAVGYLTLGVAAQGFPGDMRRRYGLTGRMSMGHGVRRAAYVAVLTVAGAGLGSAVYQSAAEHGDRRRFVPLGRMTDVRGRRIHLLELGSGDGPTVVIVPAIGGTVLDWPFLVAVAYLAGQEDLRGCTCAGPASE